MRITADDAATPTGTITAPANNAAVPRPVTITGTAADDKGVATVKLGIRQNGTNLWWNGTAWTATSTKVNAVRKPGWWLDHVELHAHVDPERQLRLLGRHHRHGREAGDRHGQADVAQLHVTG